MIHTDLKETEMPKYCAATGDRPFTSDQQVLARDVLERLSGKWALRVLHVLGEAKQPMRFSRVLEAIGGISQKVLTRALRQLECDGFVTRTIFPEVPPRVEYELTELGKSLLVQITPLFVWVVAEVDSFAAARARFIKHASSSNTQPDHESDAMAPSARFQQIK